MSFTGLFLRNNQSNTAAEALYASVVEKSRDAAFYAEFGVPDTVDGRFDMIVIHAMLVFRRLRNGGKEADDTGQALFDLMFKDMDRSLREMGVGDLSVSRHIKKMAQAFYGRAAMYEKGLDGDPQALSQAVQVNVFRHGSALHGAEKAMVEYLCRADTHVGAQDVAEIAAGRVDFSVPVMGAGHDPGALTKS
jgi:cytochrome b pre-mRNA-processing protein 3